MPKIYLRRPDGAVVTIDSSEAQAAADAGYAALSPDELHATQTREVEAAPAGAPNGLVPDTTYSPGTEFLGKAVSGATFGLAERDVRSGATAARYSAEHPYAAAAGSMLGQTPGVLLGGAAGQAIRVGAAGAGLAARAGAAAADIGINAAVGGAQIEGESSHEAGTNFSFTDAALAGVTTEVLGRGAAWGISKGVGGARNLIARAARDSVAADAERTLTKGGWVGDYRVAQHAEVYHDELADLGAKDLDTLETATADVSRQDKKRSRIMRSVVENPAAQHEINVASVEGLQRLRGALSDELAEASTGPAKRLAKQLDDRITALEAAPRGKKLWRILDENRQALQEYRQDLHQAYDSNPGSAWLSRDGLAAIDAAEEATRTSLLREDAWGEAAARMQREYNVPFHEKWFPARQTVLKDLHFATGKDAQGFTTYRGEPGKVRKFLTGLGGTSPDVHRARELFTQYLDGAEAIARAGEKDSPAAARDAIESVRRLRKNMANSTFINAAAERTSARGAVAGAVGDLAAGTAGLALGGPGGAAGGVLASRFVRSARVGEWFGNVAKHLGMFRGDAQSMAELLARDAIPHADAKAVARETLTDRLTDDIMDAPAQAPAAPFPPAESARPPGAGGPIAGEPTRGVGVDVPLPEATPGAGPGQAGRQDTPRQPAGIYAIKPQEPVRVGAEAPPGRGGGWAKMEPPAGGPASALAGESEMPSLREGAEVPLPGEAQNPTFPTPYRTAGAADLEGRLAPHLGAQSREASRMQALTEGEFAHVVDGLNATGAKAPDGTPLGDFLRKHGDDLKTAGLIAAGTGAGALADYESDSKGGSSGIRGAAAGGLAALGLSGRLGKALLLGARFEASEAGKAEAKSIVREAIHNLPPPPPQTSMHFYGHLVDPSMAKGSLAPEKLPGLKRMFEVTREAAKKLDEPEQHAISEWVGSSSPIKYEQRTGLPMAHRVGDERLAPDFESAMDRLTVTNPTKHGDLYRHVDLEDSGLADLLTKDEFKAGAHLSTAYYPDADFGPHELRFTKVDAAGGLIGVNPAEMEMVIPPDARFRVTGRYANPETGNFTFTLEEIPDTHAGGLKDVGYLAFPAAGGIGAALDSAENKDGAPAGAGMGFVGAAALFRQARGRLVADVARRLFSPTVGRAVARLAARQVYSRADLAKRQAEFQAWQENPQELVDRVAEGFREVPPDQQAQTHAGVFKAASFLRERLPQTTKTNAISMRDLPVSTEQLTKFTRYEDAALRPKDAWGEAAARGHISPELMETTEALHPDLLAELRVQAYMTVRDEGPPVTVQARLQYAALFGGDGSFADPSMGKDVAAMSALAYQQAVPTKPGGGPTSGPGGVSHVAAASGAPAGLAKLG